MINSQGQRHLYNFTGARHHLIWGLHLILTHLYITMGISSEKTHFTQMVILFDFRTEIHDKVTKGLELHHYRPPLRVFPYLTGDPTKLPVDYISVFSVRQYMQCLGSR